MKEIRVDESNPNYSSSYNGLYNKDKTTFIYYPQHCIISEFTLPNSVTEIAECAFVDCYAPTIHLPSGLTHIASWGISYTNSTLYIKATTPPKISPDAFLGSYIYRVVVPDSLVDKYKKAEGWSKLTIYSESENE